MQNLVHFLEKWSLRNCMSTLTTERLILRPWRTEDLEPFARLNADPRVMEYYPSTLSREESDRYAKRISNDLLQNGWGAMGCLSSRDI